MERDVDFDWYDYPVFINKFEKIQDTVRLNAYNIIHFTERISTNISEPVDASNNLCTAACAVNYSG